MSKSFSNIYLSKSFTVLSLIFTLKLIFEWSKIRIEFHSFHVIIQFSQEPFLKNISFPTEHLWHPCWISVNCNALVYFWVLYLFFFFFFWYIYLYINTVLHVLSSFSCIWLYATLWTAAFQVPLSVGYSSKNTGGGCHFLLQGIFPTQGTHIFLSPALASRFFITSATLT